jgi:hypothetical protein
MLRWATIVIEVLGTFFVWLDTVRLNARNPPHAITLGDPPGYSAWYFHSGLLGFSLLLLGILLQGMTSTIVRVYEARPELLLAIATVIMALVTAWMACETRRTATAAIKALEFEQMPILGFRNLKINVPGANQGDQPGMSSISVGIELCNAGRVPVRYKTRSLVLTFANRTTTSGEFLSRGGRVLPGAVSEFWLQMPLQPPVAAFPAKGRVQFEFEYLDDLGRQGYPIVGTVEYTVSSPDPHTPVFWANVD